MKKLLASILCAAILFTACAGSPASSNKQISSTPTQDNTSTAAPTGRWVEQELSFPENLFAFSLNRLKDDTIICLASDRKSELPKLLSTDNGASWQTAANSWANTAVGEDENIAFPFINENGVMMFAKVKKDRSFTLWLQKHDQEATQINLSDIPTENTGLRSFALIDDKTAVVTWQVFTPETYNSFGAIFNLETQTKIKDLEDDFDYDGGALYFAPTVQYNNELYFSSYYDNYALHKYTADGEFSTVHEKLPKHSAGAMDKEGNYYFVNEQGISRLASGGSVVESIVSNNSFAYATPNTSATKMCIAADGSVLINYFSGTNNNDMTNYIKRYYFDTSLPSESSNKTLKVWSLENNETIRTAIINFAKNNSDITVEYEAAITPETKDTASREDILRALNASLLAGEGPDVIIFDNIDYTPYIEKGLLSELSAVLDFNALLPNITSPFINDGKAYVMPAKYSVPILYGAPEKIKGFDSLDALQSAILAAKPRPNMDMDSAEYYTPFAEKDKYALGFVDIRQLFDFAMNTSANAIIENNTINEDALKKMLSFIKAISDHYNMAAYNEHMKNGIALSSDGDAITVWDGGYEYNSTGNALYGWNLMQTPSMLSSVYGMNMKDMKKQDAGAIIQPGLCEGAYLPSTFAGININTKKQEAAAEFVKTIFSDETQGTFSNDGNPVTVNGNDAMFERNKNAINDKNYKGDAKALYNSLKTPVIINAGISDVIYKHVQQLCLNKQSLDEAVTGIKNDLAIYLQEKN